MRVLVVDDDEAGRYLVSAVLRNSGHEVIEAVDGVDALAKAAANPVDVAVSDVLMPNMDGYALCRAWKADPTLSKAPFVFYTATYTEPADEEFAASLGADGFYTKPQEPEVLLHLIAGAVHGHEGKTGQPRAPERRAEEEILREYNTRLVAKLEHKLVELAEANAVLRASRDVLAEEVEVKKVLIEQLTADMEVREAEKRRRIDAEELSSEVFEESPVGIVTLDRGFVVTSWNDAATRTLGWTAEEVVGSPYPAGSDAMSDELSGVCGPILRGESPGIQREFVRTHKDGHQVTLWISVAPLRDAAGNVTGLLCFMQDITDARRVEMVKSGFVSMISHELRTPLTSIIGYSELLGTVDPAEEPGHVRDLADEIRSAGDRMRRLVDDLLKLSQVESGPLELSFERVDVGEFLAAETDKVETDERHALVLDIEDDLPHVFVDKERMSSAVQHLVENAVKYSPDGGEIAVRARAAEGFVRIEVEDHGIGIEPGDLEHIFDRFTQGDMSDTRQFRGLGAGLFLARRFVEAHSGRLEVRSKPGQGSVFTIVLPVLE